MSEPGLAPGSVVAIGEPGCDELLPAVVLSGSDDTVTIVPVSERVDLATEWDLLLPVQALGYAAVAEVWNYGSVLPEQLHDVLGELDTGTSESLRSLARAAVAGSKPPADAAVGPPVLDDADPRLLFQDAEAERCRPFWEPALALAGALTLGQLVAHRREELAVEADELETVGAGAGGWLSELERDELDLRRRLPPTSLAALMRQLRIGASRRLGRIAAYTIETQRLGGGAALARKSDSVGAPDDAAQGVEEYVDAFLQDLGDR